MHQKPSSQERQNGSSTQNFQSLGPSSPQNPSNPQPSKSVNLSSFYYALVASRIATLMRHPLKEPY